MTLVKPIGGNFSLNDSDAFISSQSSDSLCVFFPEKLNQRQLIHFETGTDSLAFIVTQIFLKKGNIPIFFPKHYCGDTIERLKLKVSGLKIYFYSEIADLKLESQHIVIYNHFNKFTKVQERLIHQKNSICIEDFVHAPLDLNKTTAPYSFNSLRKFCNLELSLAYVDFSIAEIDVNEMSDYYSKKKKAETEKANWQKSPNRVLEESFLEQFKEAEKELYKEKIQRGNSIEIKKLKYYQFEQILLIRRANHHFLKHELSGINEIQLIEGDYMFLMIHVLDRNTLRKILFDNNIFPPIHWLDSPDEEMSKTLLSLPIDQRYNETDLKRIVTVIKSFYDN